MYNSYEKSCNDYGWCANKMPATVHTEVAFGRSQKMTATGYAPEMKRRLSTAGRRISR